MGWMSVFFQRNAVVLLKWQWWDLHGSEPSGFGDSGRGSVPQEAVREEAESQDGLVWKGR